MPEARSAASRRFSFSRSEMPVVIHLAILIVGLSWYFGGSSPGARIALLAWGTAGIGLFLFLAFRQARRGRAVWGRAALCLGPLLALDALVLASCFNPSMQPVLRNGEQYLMVVSPPHPWLPASARPAFSAAVLWQLNVIVISCANAFLFIERRQTLRLLLAIIAGNALLLAVFGTFQQLSGAQGLWFGLVATRQPLFFSTFVYHNHWGAFTVLNLAACLGLLFHAWRRGGYRDLWHSPVPMGAIGTLLLAASVPLSASRSSTVLAGVLLVGSFIHVLIRITGDRRRSRRSAVAPVTGAIVGALVGLAAIGYVGRKVIADRARLTSEQLQGKRVVAYGMERDTYLGSRARLYRDTWRMAMVHPYTGWGLGSYGSVFRMYNTAPFVIGEPQRAWYNEAHNDWLQSIAETGFIGTGFLVLLGLAPLGVPRWRRVGSKVPHYLLAGCGLILVYACLEFPFANPSVLVAFCTSLYIAARYAVLDSEAESNE